jgi:CheY-like chemotaxis protein
MLVAVTLEISTDAAMKTILVVDDEPEMRAVLAVLLAECGFTMLEAADGIEGNAIVQNEGPNLIIFDWMMPRMNGVRLYKRATEDF